MQVWFTADLHLGHGNIIRYCQRPHLNEEEKRRAAEDARGRWHLYGHVHGRLDAEDRANPSSLTRDVGVDACDYRPWRFDDLRAYMAPRVLKFHQTKQAMQRGEDVDLA